MAGHMGSDRLAARRGALIDLLADGRPHTREAIWQWVAADVGEPCWGKRPNEALLRDIAALRRGGLRIMYSRRPGLEGYYLAYPSIAARRPPAGQFPSSDHLDAPWRQRLRELDVAQKNDMAFGAADFALQQKRLLIQQEQPHWPAEQVDREARRLVFGVKVDFYVPHEPELRAMIDERVYLPFDQMRRAAYVTATGVIVAKLRAYLDSGSTRHLDDIAGIVRVQAERLDVRLLDRRAAQLGCYGVWRALWAER